MKQREEFKKFISSPPHIYTQMDFSIDLWNISEYSGPLKRVLGMLSVEINPLALVS